MLELLALALAALNPPLPMVAPPDCRVEATATHLVVKSQGAEARYELTSEDLPFAPGAGRPKVTVLPLPGSKDTLLAALREPWEGVAAAGLGRLYEVTCGATPAIRVAMVAPGIDFGRVAIARDGRWIVGGWGGLRVLDPNQRRLTPLTSPPAYAAPGCWTAEEGKPARAADVPIVGADGIARSPVRAPAAAGAPDEIAFLRGGACGYEGAMRTTHHALLLDRGVVRGLVEVATFALGDDGRLLAGDGAGPCEAQTAGSFWSSSDGAGWIRMRVTERGAPGIARLVRLANGGWLALTAICANGETATGGDLFVSADLTGWEPVLAFPEGSSPVRGGGVGELLVVEGRVYAALGSGDRARWAESRDGKVWRPSGKRVLVPVPNWLAKTLGVTRINGRLDTPDTSYAWTSDGLFRRAKGPPLEPWARIFPRAR